MNWRRFYMMLKNNLGIKILALLVAVVLWLYVLRVEEQPFIPSRRLGSDAVLRR